MDARKSLQLNRLRVLRRGHVAYDQVFHEGVNIIRGQNGSGKSTIADFIFFILGGEFDDWKDAAKQCDEVQAEIDTPKGKLTLRRSIDSKLAPVHMYFGNLEEANKHALEGWQSFPIRRQGGKESFSQVMFRSLTIPEAQSEGASNITMHQLLRLCYSDQRTPATRLFRFEPFDTQNIREAVGDLMCGISGYEIYEIGLKLREFQKQLDEVSSRLSGLLKALPPDEALSTSISIYSKISELSSEKATLKNEIEMVDQRVALGEINKYLRARHDEQAKISQEREHIQKLEFSISKLEFEAREINEFLIYIEELTNKLKLSEAALSAIGSLEFIHCPACGAELKSDVTIGHCTVCKNPTDPEKEQSRYNQIRLDLEIQTRESKQLLAQKESMFDSAKQDLRTRLAAHERAMTNFDMKYSGGNGPREAYLAEKTSRIGHISAEIDYLTRSLGIASEIDSLNQKKSSLQSDVDKLKQRNQALNKQAFNRRTRALSQISDIAVSLLHSDLKRQDEFEIAQKVEINFISDAMSVDGQINFAESSNVFLKNSAILSMHLAACSDNAFHHPKFLLIDNIEDKGMELERSHLFQKLIVERATELEVPFQIIFTTSMMNPKLELDDYVIGPSYTKELKTLDIFPNDNRPMRDVVIA
jgi:hypothetical protein